MFFHNDISKDHARAKKFFENILAFTIGTYSLKNLIKDKISDIIIIDVREYEDYIHGHIPFAIHIPYEHIEEHIDMLEKDKMIIIYTYNDSCPRAYKSAWILTDKHFHAVTLRGGFCQWKKFDFDVVKTEA